MCFEASESDETIEEDMPESPGLEKHEKENQDQQKKNKTRLKKFLTRRPSLQAVKDKGYIKGKDTHINLYILEFTHIMFTIPLCV